MAGNKSVELDVLARNEEALRKIRQVKEDYEKLKAEMKADPAAVGLTNKQVDQAYNAEMRKAAQALFGGAEQEIKKVGDESDKAKFKVASLGHALADLTTGGVGFNWGEMSLVQKALAGLSAATGIAEPAVAGLTLVTMGLAAGLTSAALGLGVFGVVAKSVFTGANQAASDYAAIQNATTGKQAQAALKKYNEDLSKLPASQRELAKSIIGVKGEWQNFVKANTDGVAVILTKGLGLVAPLLKDMQLFMKPVETVLSTIITQLGKGIQSSGFQSWIGSFAKLSGANLYEFAAAIGNVAKGLGGILKAFLPFSTIMMSGLDHITAKFANWGMTLSSHSGFKSLVTEAMQEAPKMASALGKIADAVKNVMGQMAGMTTIANSTLLWNLINPLTQLLDTLSQNKTLVDVALWGYAVYSSLNKVVGLSSGLMGVLGTLDKFSGGGLTKLGGAMGLLKNTAAEGEEAVMGLNLAFLTSPIFWVIAAIVALVVVFYELWNHCAAFRNFWKDLWKDIKGAAVDVWHWMENTWKGLKDILVKPFKDAWNDIMGVFHTITSWVSTNFDGWWKNNGDAIKEIWRNLWSWVSGYFKLEFKIVADVVKIYWTIIKTEFTIAWNIIKAIWSIAWPWLHMFLKIYWTLISTEFKIGWEIIKAVFTISLAIIKTAWDIFWTVLLAILKTAWAVIKGEIKIAWDIIVGIFSIFINLVTGHWGKAWLAMKNMVTQVWNALTGIFHSAFNNLWGAISSSFGRVIDFFKGLGHTILTAVGNIGNLLFQAGKNVIQGLINGITSSFGGIVSTMGKVTGFIRDHLPFSPAKMGPLSGQGSPEIAGKKIAQMLAAGLDMGMGSVSLSTTRMLGAVTGAHVSGSSGRGGSAALTAEWIGGAGADAEFITWLKKNIRIRGGNPAVLGR